MKAPPQFMFLSEEWKPSAESEAGLQPGPASLQRHQGDAANRGRRSFWLCPDWDPSQDFNIECGVNMNRKAAVTNQEGWCLRQSEHMDTGVRCPKASSWFLPSWWWQWEEPLRTFTRSPTHNQKFIDRLLHAVWTHSHAVTHRKWTSASAAAAASNC